MGAREKRVQQLEQAQPRPRCATCREWPERIVYANDWRPADQREEPACPARCDACGWEPETITVRYVDDWRGDGGDGAAS